MLAQRQKCSSWFFRTDHLSSRFASTCFCKRIIKRWAWISGLAFSGAIFLSMYIILQCILSWFTPRYNFLTTYVMLNLVCMNLSGFLSMLKKICLIMIVIQLGLCFWTIMLSGCKASRYSQLELVESWALLSASWRSCSTKMASLFFSHHQQMLYFKCSTKCFLSSTLQAVSNPCAINCNSCSVCSSTGHQLWLYSASKTYAQL